MIICNYSEINNGQVLAHLFIKIVTTGKVEHYSEDGLFVTRDLAEKKLHSWLFNWMKTKIRHYYNQRSRAIEHFKKQARYTDQLKGISNLIEWGYSDYESFCKGIIRHESDLVALLPPIDSPQRSWREIIQQIISHAHYYIHEEQKRSLPGPSQLPQQTENNLAGKIT